MSGNENQVKRILYVRCAPYKLTFDSYNLQEVGLGNAFCRKGYEFDLVYYSKENRDQIIYVGDRKLRILWRKGFKFLRISRMTFHSLYQLWILIIFVSPFMQVSLCLIRGSVNALVRTQHAKTLCSQRH